MNGNSIKGKLKVGFSSRLLLSLLSICYFGSFINVNLSLVYSNIPMFTFLKFEVYRLITSLFMSDCLYEYLFNLFVVLTIFNFWENKDGTSKFIIKFVINLLIVQIAMLILYLLLYYFFPIIISYKIKILPSLGIAFLVKHLLLTNTKNVLLYTGKKINDRLLIVLFIVGFLIMNGREFKIEMWISFYYGFLMCKFPKIYDVEMINEESVLHFEKNENYRFIVNLDSWIPIDENYIKKSNVSNIPSNIENSKDIVLDNEENKIEIEDDPPTTNQSSIEENNNINVI